MKCLLGLFMILSLTGLITSVHIHLKIKETHKASTLEQGHRLDSKNEKYYATLQIDGDFVVYSSGVSNGLGKDYPIWATNTNGKGTAPYKVIMQTDGNLVLYDTNKSPVWNSQTQGKGVKPYKLVMQDDGNLVCYSKDTPIWASKTLGKH